MNVHPHTVPGSSHSATRTMRAVLDYPVVSAEQLGADGISPWAALSVAAWHERLAAGQPGLAGRRHHRRVAGALRAAAAVLEPETARGRRRRPLPYGRGQRPSPPATTSG